MAQTETRPGFRLPWTGEQGEPAQTREATPEPEVAQDTNPAQEPMTPDMIDATATPVTRRPTKFMAELSKAMQVAAETARDETLARLSADLKVVVEQIHAASTVEAAELRRRADDDVAAVRDWSKAEIARIREETEARITLRKTALDGEVEAHGGTVATRVESVGETVAAFEAQMATFFERLRAEEDPTRIATMAEAMPDPPDLSEVAALSAAPAAEVFGSRLAAIAAVPAEVEANDASEAPADDASADEATGTETETEIATDKGTSESSGPDFAAAEAEAAAFTGDGDDDESVAQPVAPHDEADNARLAATADEISMPIERSTTRVVVNGLVSVASIATFKRSLGHVAGVSTIGVASGPDGEFVFTVSHAGVALADVISELPGFGAQVTPDSTGGLLVIAHDPDTGA